ncbi:L,D-transpeptidase [Acidithiobacillus marinus]|uniref:L,D-transpeptidase n=1 Tax=Acidithiobacillus marinus TaxID=187490 RepID=A0A2I1DLS2_9PROT|nr:L,D-transpeptidase [Acidithiobacillus marinus]
MSNPSLSLKNDPSAHWLWVDVAGQQLRVMAALDEQAQYPVSTALKGLGELRDSACTPRGWHQVRAKIGAGLPNNAILRGRRWTGACFSPRDATDIPQQDWILGRILWLSGMEPGLNRGALQDTFRRYIYIHGTADTARLGQAVSAGCIRMHPETLCSLFPAIAPGHPVFIGLQPPVDFPPLRRS